MKHLFASLCLSVGLCACTTTPPTATFNDKLALAVESVTTARKAATTLLIAGKITVEEDASLQAKLDIIVGSLKAAKAIQSNDPAQATALLTTALNNLAQIGVSK